MGGSISNLTPGTSYTVVSTNASCSSTSSSTFIIDPINNTLSVSVSSTPTSCGNNNGTATATANGGINPYNFSWNTTPVQSLSTAVNLAAGSYTVTVTDANNCIATATTTVGSSTALNVSINGSTTICSGTSTVITATAPGATTYSWSTTPVQSTSSITVSPSSATTYTLTASDGGTCSGTASITVSVVSKPNVNISGDNVICLGERTTLTASGTGNYLWTPGGSTSNSITVSPTASTMYYVDITNGNPAGCNTDRDSLRVQVGGVSGSINAGSDQTITIGQSATLTAMGSSNTYTWSTNDEGSTITVSPLETTTYSVFSQDNFGCKVYDSIIVNVDVKCGEVFVPTGFSPNADGSNDLECVYGNCIKTIYWAIYDRWGEKVFETTDKEACWDGIYKGQLLNSGVFVYKLEVQQFDGKQVLKNGSITISR